MIHSRKVLVCNSEAQPCWYVASQPRLSDQLDEIDLPNCFSVTLLLAAIQGIGWSGPALTQQIGCFASSFLHPCNYVGRYYAVCGLYIKSRGRTIQTSSLIALQFRTVADANPRTGRANRRRNRALPGSPFRWIIWSAWRPSPGRTGRTGAQSISTTCYRAV